MGLMGEWDADGGTVPAPTMDCPSIQPAGSEGGGGGQIQEQREQIMADYGMTAKTGDSRTRDESSGMIDGHVCYTLNSEKQRKRVSQLAVSASSAFAVRAAQ